MVLQNYLNWRFDCGVWRRNPWAVYLGDCPVVTSLLSRRPADSPAWLLAHTANIFLRAVGQPAFVNNPLLGIVILAALFLPEPAVGLGAMLGGLAATLTELALTLHPPNLVTNGVAAFNGVLVGTCVPILYPLVYQTDRTAVMWAAVGGGAVVSVFFASAFCNFLGKFNLPYLALPFNVVAVTVFLALQPPGWEEVVRNSLSSNSTVQLVQPVAAGISWSGLGRGVLVSMGQVWAVNSVQASAIINIAVLLSSPLLFFLSNFGAALGCLLSLSFLHPSEYPAIYDGLWGYNALLSMAAVSCVFFPLTPASLVAGTVNTAATVFIQRALAASLARARLPVFTLPVTLCSLVFLLARQDRPGAQLVRVAKMSYPERQAVQASRLRRDLLQQQKRPEHKEELDPVLV